MKIEVSNGELLDKLSILEIKLDKIRDHEKQINVKHEYSLLKPLCEDILPMVSGLYENLVKINRQLWDIEDTIRELDRLQEFGDEFVFTARQVYRLNDERSRLKKEINMVTGSGLIEEKSYTGY